MKKLLIIFTASFLFGACSQSKTDVNANSSAPNTAEVKKTTAESLPVDGNVANNSPTNVNANTKIIVVNTNTGNASKDLKTSTMAATTAPDNSTFTSGMDKDGNFFELRTFIDHPTLVKVERKVLGKTSIYKIYFKSGKVLEAPPEKMANFRNIAPENILDAVGLFNPQTKGEQPKSEAKKEK